MEMYDLIKQVGIGGLGAGISIYLIYWITTKVSDRMEKIQKDCALTLASNLEIYKRLDSTESKMTSIELKINQIYDMLNRGLK